MKTVDQVRKHVSSWLLFLVVLSIFLLDSNKGSDSGFTALLRPSQSSLFLHVCSQFDLAPLSKVPSGVGGSAANCVLK